MGKAKPPPPPSPIINYDALFERLAAGDQEVILALALIIVPIVLYVLYLCLRKTGGVRKKKLLVATCEIGPNGKPVGAIANAKVNTPLPPKQRSPSLEKQGSIPSFVHPIASRVSGMVTLSEQPDGSTLIEYYVEGLQPGEHGFRINEKSDFSNGCLSAGPIFDPYNAGVHGGLNDPYGFAGSLGNITADGTGQARGKITSTQLTLKGKASVIGRSIMVHADKDDMGKGDNSKANETGAPKNGYVSKVTGNAGARLACGEIKLSD